MAAYTRAYTAIRLAVGRPAEPAILSSGKCIRFQLQDVVVSDTLLCANASPASESLYARAIKGPTTRQDANKSKSTVVTMFGCTQNGESVAVHVHGFQPSLWLSRTYLQCHCT